MEFNRTDLITVHTLEELIDEFKKIIYQSLITLYILMTAKIRLL